MYYFPSGRQGNILHGKSYSIYVLAKNITNTRLEPYKRIPLVDIAFEGGWVVPNQTTSPTLLSGLNLSYRH